ncbi:MAG TPA: serine/threonine-protein kinase, partial [Ktedonobacteraceae bacterium]|nr:serine/threonine-protein kinase [Ktedonobacteraceae bacterium]
MAESKKLIGSVGQLVGDYRLLRLLGGGGFGEVYLAEHVRDHTYAAVKILQAHLTHSEDLKAFINEARTFRLKHPHIVPLLDFGIVLNDVPYLVMEYAPHGTLRERHPAGTQVPLPVVVSYVKQIASALQYAHDHYLIHRDVKPENMLVGANGEILLTDFGIAAVAHNSFTLSKEQENIGGTASYMAPEQFEGKPRPASDQYALGVLTYEWLSGKRPFQGTPMEVMMQHMAASPTSLSQLVPRLNPIVERVVFTALAKDPKQRFGSIRAFATALEEAAGGRTTAGNVEGLFTSGASGRMEYQGGVADNRQFTPLRVDVTQSARQDTPTIPYGQGAVPNVTSAAQKRRKPRVFLVGVLVLALLLVLGGGAAFAMMTLSNNAQIAATATATAQLATSTVTSHMATST